LSITIYQSGEEYQSIFENAIEGIFQSSLDGHFLKVNPAMARIYGYDSPEDMIASIRSIKDQIYVDAEERKTFLKSLQENGRVDRFEERNYRKDGSLIWTLTNARIVKDDEGNPLFIEGFLTDITSRKEAELALQASEERYRALVERLPGAVFLDAPDDSEKNLYISKKIEDIFGYTPREWNDEISWSSFIHPEDRDRILVESKRTDITGEPFREEYRFRKKDGQYIWVREETSLVKDEHGAPLFWQGFLTDISYQKQVENAIKQSEEQFKKIFQANPIASCIATLEEGRIIAANNAYWDLSGFKPDEVLGHTSIDLGFIDTSKRKKLVKRLRKEKSLRNETGNLITKNKEIRNTLEFFDLISFDGQDCILSMFYDMTNQIKARAALRESEEKYRELFESESDAIFLIDNTSGNILEVNAAATALYGYNKEELLRMKNSDLSAEPEETRQVTQKTPIDHEQVISIPLRFHKKKDGIIFPVEITGRFFEWRGRPVHIAAIRDITERRKVDEALIASEERFRLAFQTSPDAININRLEDGLYIDVNEGFTAITGYTREETIGKTSAEINIWENLNSRARLIDELKKNGFVNNLEAKFRMKDGRVLTGLMSARIIMLEGVPHIISITREIETIKQTESTLQKQLKELTILHNIAVAASSSKTVDELLQRATATIADTLYPDNCGAELVTDRDDSYQAHPSYRGASKKGIREPTPLSKGVVGKVIATGKPIRLGNVDQEVAYIEVTKGIRSELCVPIKIQDRVIGAFNIETKQADAFTESDERLLNTVAGTLAAAIEQLRLLETSQRHLQELTILNTVSLACTRATSLDDLVENITQIIGESLYPDNFGVLLLNEEGTALTPHSSYRGISTQGFPASISINQGISGQVVASGKSIRIANVRSNKKYIEVTPQVRSELCVPITHGKRIFGVINAESLKINAFTEDDEQLLTTIASTLAIAVEKLRLLEAEKKRRQEAEILLEATTALTTSLNLDTLFDSVLEILSKIVPYESASISMERKGKLLIVAGRGFPPGYEGVGKQLAYSEKWLRMSTSHKAVILSDVHLEPDFEQWKGSEYIRGWMGVPMIVHGKIIGFINLDSRLPNAFTEKDAILAQTFANSAAVAIENARLFEIEQQNRKRAEALREATATLTTSIELEALYDTILNSLSKLIPFDSASIEILDQGYLEVVAGLNLKDNEDCLGKRYAFNVTKWEGLESLRQPIRLPNVQEDDRFVKFKGTEYIHGWMGVPMFAQDKLVGFLNLDSSKVDFFTQDHAALAQTFGNQAAIVIENARLFQEENRRSQIIEAMANIANEFSTAYELLPALDKITNRALELLNASTVAIYLLQDDNKTIKVVTAQGTHREQLMSHTIQIGTGITGNIIATGKPEIVDNMLNDSRRLRVPGTPEEEAERDTIMSAPLIVRGKTIGAINAWRRRSSGLFNESELNFLVNIAHQTSMSIESIRLFQETARRAQEAHAIAEVGRDISTTLQLDIVLDRIAQYAKDLLRVETSAVYLSSPEEPMLRAIAAIGIEAREIMNDPLPIGSGILGHIALQKSGEIVNDTQGDPRAIIIKDTEIIPNEHLMGVPVLSKDQLTGLLAVWRTGEREEFKPYELDFLSGLAQQAAVAIENARLFEAEQRRHRESETLRQAALAITTSLELENVLETILVVMKQVVPYDSASVLLLDGNKLRLTAAQGFPNPEGILNLQFSADDNLFEEVRKSEKPVILKNAQKDKRFKKWAGINNVRGWMGVPMFAQNRFVGFLNLDSSTENFFTDDHASLAQTFGNQAAVAIENARLFDAEQKRRREAEILREASAALTSSFELIEVLNTLLDQVAILVPYDSAAVFLLEKDHYKVVAGRGYRHPEKVIGQNLPLDDEFSRIVRETRQVYISQDIHMDPRFKRWGDADNIHGWMCFPLIVRDQVIGHLTIDSFEIGAYDASHAELAMAFANQAATAIENARQFEIEQRHFQESETLRQAAEAITSTLDIQQVLALILDNLNRVVPFDTAGVFLIESEKVRLTAFKGTTAKENIIDKVFPASNALLQEIWRTKKPIILKNAQNDSRYEKWVVNQTCGWMGIPLIARGNIIGYITIDSLKVAAYNDHDANLAMTFAHQAAAVIENARLYERGEQQIRQLTVLRDIDSAISSSFDLRVTLNLLIGYAARELNADAIAVLLYNSDLKSLSLYASTGFTNKHNTLLSHIRLGEGFAGRVVLQRKLVHVADLNKSVDFSLAPYIVGENFKSYYGVPLLGKGQIKGVMEVFTREETHPDPDWLNFLHTLAGQAAIAIDNVQLFKNLQRSNQELILAYDTTLAGWGRALELRDKETQGHTDRVVELTIELARRTGIEGEELTHIMRGALLHDIGKMGIPDNILHKPGPLTEEEWVIMRQHPQYAYDLMYPIPYLRPALDIPYAHHERWDGSGYPRGLKGEDIPLAARIFAVVDIWDALLYKRVYRDAWPEEQVLEYLKNTAGIELDPDIVENFLELLEEERYKNQAD
jgi:PAS domain S-box-containing protein